MKKYKKKHEKKTQKEPPPLNRHLSQWSRSTLDANPKAMDLNPIEALYALQAISALSALTTNVCKAASRQSEGTAARHPGRETPNLVNIAGLLRIKVFRGLGFRVGIWLIGWLVGWLSLWNWVWGVWV